MRKILVTICGCLCVVAITIITIVGRADAKTGGEKGGKPFNHRPKPVDCILFVVGGGTLFSVRYLRNMVK